MEEAEPQETQRNDARARELHRCIGNVTSTLLLHMAYTAHILRKVANHSFDASFHACGT